jgi:hypothetical protein
MEPSILLWFTPASFLNNTNGLVFAASGLGRCQINNGGCWKETKNGKTVSACSVRCHLITNVFYLLVV